MIFTILATALAATLAVPADPTTAAIETPAPAPAPTPVANAASKREKRYCVVDTHTGSRIPIKQCHTRDIWLQRGFDPLAPTG